VTGTIDAPRALLFGVDRPMPGFQWQVQAGIGANPAEHKWFTLGTGEGRHHFHGVLGRLPLSRIPKKMWAKPFALSQTQELETSEQYTVSFRLQVTDSRQNLAEDRRSIAVTHDPTWLPHFPLRLRASGESQPALSDLQATGRRDIVFGDTNGLVHALDPQTGRELPGWPAHTLPLTHVRRHRGVAPGDEPVVADVAVGDLNADGRQYVVATSTSGNVYVFDDHGELQPGWPKPLNQGVTPPAIPRPALPYTRLPAKGAVAGPVLFDLNGDDTLEIVQAGWDGSIHVWEPDGADVQGWPVKVSMPNGYSPPPNMVLVNDQKLDSPPAIAFLQGQGSAPDIVVRPQYTETQDGGGLQPVGAGYVFAYGADGSLLSGFPVRMPSPVEYYGSAQEFITEGSASPVVADVTGSGSAPDMIAVGPVLSPPYLIDGAGQIQSNYGPTPSFPPGPGADVPVAFTTSGAFGMVNGVLTFAQAETGSATLATSLLQPNSGTAINEYEAAYPATGGAARPGFPVARQGIDFLGEPVFADVTGDGDAEIIDGGDSNALHAYDGTGAMAAGFPKWTTGWSLFSPAAGDLLGDGKVELVSTTREGYLMVWTTAGVPAGLQWARAQHDNWNSGRWGTTVTP